MKDIKNIIIQNLNDFQKGLVHQAMASTGQSTASKAIFQILSEHIEVKKELFELKSNQGNIEKKRPTPQVKSNDSKVIPPGTDSLSRANQETYNHIIENPDATSETLAELAGKDSRIIVYRINTLRKAGLITVRNDGNLRRYSVTEG